MAQSGPSFKKYFKIVERNNKKKTNSDKNRKIKTKQKMDKEEWMQWALCLLNFCASLFFFFRFFCCSLLLLQKNRLRCNGNREGNGTAPPCHLHAASNGFSKPVRGSSSNLPRSLQMSYELDDTTRSDVQSIDQALVDGTSHGGSG